MQIAGWMETEEGARTFEITATDMRDAAKQLRALDSDAGHTDMEACDENGDDVTTRLYASLDKL